MHDDWEGTFYSYVSVILFILGSIILSGNYFVRIIVFVLPELPDWR